MAGRRDMGMAGRVGEDQNGHGGRLAGWVGEVNAEIQQSRIRKRLPRPLRRLAAAPLLHGPLPFHACTTVDPNETGGRSGLIPGSHLAV
jgi:hypothetical protein